MGRGNNDTTVSLSIPLNYFKGNKMKTTLIQERMGGKTCTGNKTIRGKEVIPGK